MKQIIYLCFCLFTLCITAQTPEAEEIVIDETTTIIDTDGKKTTILAVMDKLESGTHDLEPVFNTDGTLKEAKLIKLSPEEIQAMNASMEALEKEDMEKIGTIVPDFSFKDMNGKTYSKADLKGKVVVMNFWFIQCQPCVMEMPDLNKLVSKYKNNKNVVFLAPTFNEKDAVASFLKKITFNYTIAPNAESTVQSFGINSFPTSFVMDKEGKYELYLSGGIEHVNEPLELAIESALKH